MTPEDDVTTVIETVDLISKKWHPAIIQALLEDGPLRFSELQSTLDGISGKVLTDSLDDLVEKGLIDRTVVSESPRRVEYDLTAHGQDLQSVIEALAEWGDAHLGEQAVPGIMVVDDDPRLARMHAEWLEAAGYDVTTVHDGRTAIRELGDHIDVVLLDRRMPGMSGDTVLERIDEFGLDCVVVMLTAVEPDADVLDMGFDDYLVKPGLKAEVVETVEAALDRRGLDQSVRTYFALLAKRRLLEAELTTEERAASDRFQRLVNRLEELEAELDGLADAVDETDAVTELLSNDQ